MDKEELENSNDGTMNESTAEETAGNSSPEDTVNKQWANIIENQNAMIDALTKQNERLSKQMADLVNNGAQINDGQKAFEHSVDEGQSGTPQDDKPFVPLDDLGKYLGTTQVFKE